MIIILDLDFSRLYIIKLVMKFGQKVWTQSKKNGWIKMTTNPKKEESYRH